MSFTKVTSAGIGSTELVTLHSLEVINNASIGGVLTYEDVTNVDSVGIITARAGVLVGSGITLSKDGDGFFTGIVTATSFSGSGTNLTGIDTDLVSDTSPQLGGNLDVNTKNIVFGDSSDGSSDDVLKFGAGSDLSIYHDGSHSNIINTTGVLKVRGAAGQSITFRNGDDSANVAVFNVDDATHLYHDSSHKFSTTSTGIKVIGNCLPNSNDSGQLGTSSIRWQELNITDVIDISDNGKIRMGDGDDMQLYHDGTTNYIECSSNFAIRVNSGNRIEVNGSSGDVTMQGSSGKNFLWDNSAAYLNLNDNARLTLGTGNDLALYHNGSTNICNVSSGQQLYFQINSSNKFYVQSGGAQFVGSLYGDDDNKIELGDSQDLKIYHNSSASDIISSSGSLTITNSANNQHINLKKATGGDIRILDSSNNNTHIFETGGALRFLGSQTREGNSNSILTSGNNSLDFNGTEYMYFRIANNERARFQNSNNGYFQIGRSGNTPANAQLGIAVNNSICGIQLISDGNSGHEHIRFNNTNGEVGRITTSGSGTTYYTSSDYRLKENDVAISDGVTRVKQLRPIKFNWKANPSETVEGFFAHEVQAIVPEAVDRSKDQVVTQADIDEEKFKQDELGDPLYQAYDASRLVPLLTAAVKELITRVENLESA